MCIILSTLYTGEGGKQSPQNRVVKFVAGRMVFPVEHLTLSFKFPGGTLENAREQSERKPKQFTLLATVPIMAAAGAC